MDEAKFFSRVRVSLYGGTLKQITVSNIKTIFAYWNLKYGDNVNSQLAYILATVLAEVGANMNPVRETFAKSDAEARRNLRHKSYAQSTPPYGHAYYGRGYVQLTHKYNYETQEKKLGVPLVEFPDLALAPENAIIILVEGMMAGDYNKSGKGLDFYVNARKTDFVNARRTVNVLDRAVEIADYATKFLDAIEYATLDKPVTGELMAFSVIEKIDPLQIPSPEHMEIQYSLFHENNGREFDEA